jgi:hypothetical protein
LLKTIPHIGGSPQVRELVRYYMDIEMRGVGTGPASLQLAPHALALVADLPRWWRRPTLAQISRSASARSFTTTSRSRRFASINERTTI